MEQPAEGQPPTGKHLKGVSRRRFLELSGVGLGAGVLVGSLPAAAEATGSGPSRVISQYIKRPPFSFTYDGKPSAGLLSAWPRRESVQNLGGGRRQTTVVWTDPATHLTVRWVVTEYSSFPTVSWTVYFDNTGKANSSRLADVLAIDLTLDKIAGGDWTIHTAAGNYVQTSDFAPLDLPLSPGTFKMFYPLMGMSTQGLVNVTDQWTYVQQDGYMNNDVHYSGTPGASASFTFSGTSVEWLGPKNTVNGICDVYLDGSKVASVDLYAPSWVQNNVLYSSDQLTDASHTIKIVLTDSKNPAATDYYATIDAFEYVSGGTSYTVNDDSSLITYSTVDSSNVGGGWPYYNIDWGNAGLIMAMGWPGQWAVELKRADRNTLQLLGGMSHNDALSEGDEIGAADLTDLWLEPGESIRTALVVVQPWQGGEWRDAQNVWRRWFIGNHMPRVNGKLPEPICPTQANDYFGGQIDTVQDELTWLNAYGAHDATAGTGGVHDHWWIDSGWYEIPDATLGWEDVGTWTPDPQRFPDGVKPVFDRAHELGMSAILWFEPERVMPGTWLYENHLDWLLPAPPGYTSFWGPDGAYHFNFGNPDALQWAIEHFDGLITSQGVDLYREDCNYPFLAYWTYNDPPDRRGITQARYVQGHLTYWETLRQRHPGLLIDNSAGSGHRLDIQLMQHSVSNIQDDEVFDTTGNQCHTYGVRYWLPWTGMAVRITGSSDDVYNARSAMGMSYHEALDITSATDADWALLKQLAAEWREVADEYYGDYYPLTPYSADSSVWMAWQFNRPENDSGVVQAYRRPDSPQADLQVRLRGLVAGRRYILTDYQAGNTWTALGRDLMNSGLAISLSAASATNIRYRSR